MYVVRETITAKPGMASKMAAAFKAIATNFQGRYTMRVMADAIGPFNTVVFETEISSIDEFAKLEQELVRSEIREVMKGYTEMYLTGKREVFRLV